MSEAELAHRKSVVVTGASSGIGAATVSRLVAQGWQVWGTLREAADREAIEATGARALLMDVTDAASVRAAATELTGALNGPLGALVNNAGRGLCKPLLSTPPETMAQVLDVNLVGVLRTVQAFVPLMGRGGRIVNVSSTGGRTAFPFMGAYVASKHGLEGMSATLRRELRCLGIEVVVVAPGPVNTPIWRKVTVDPADREGPFAESLARFEHQLHQSGREGLRPEVVARTIEHALCTARPRTRYRIAPQPVKAWLGEKLPEAWIDRFLARQLGLEPDDG